ncbi:MAG: hypothetical protein M3Y87_07975 [Myxococcota bacterium]|nr:hypothetical protein [Myxococcota bacterium]
MLSRDLGTLLAGTLLPGCIAGGLFASGCAAGPAVPAQGWSDDGGVVSAERRTQMAPGAASGVDTTQVVSHLPAPFAPEDRPDSPSGSACRIDRPPGDCDRCPERACRQVRLGGAVSLESSEWVAFCEQGDTREEAIIACLCAGGTEHECRLSAQDTVVALAMIDHVFGGDVPPIGHRYRDADGLRAVVDEPMHLWLAASAGPSPTIRCDAPDRDAAEQRYQEQAQRVRITGHCADDE